MLTTLPIGPPAKLDGGAASPGEGTVFFIGTATVLVRFAGFTVLTDPNFLHRGERVHLGYGLHATRRTEPALSIGELPPLDLVVLSHMHEDHFDRVAARGLDHALPIATTRHAAVALGEHGFTAVRALRTWDALELTKGAARLRVTSLPGRHGPGPVAALLPPVMGTMLDFDTGASRYRIYVSGDTLVHAALREIPRRFPDVDLALLHLGGTRVLGILVTMDARQGVEAMRIVRPRMTTPIHYDDYTAFKSPLADFERAVKAAGLRDQVHLLARGETFRFRPQMQATAAATLGTR